MKIVYRRLLVWLMGLLGIGSCSKIGSGGGIFGGGAVCMYGTPTARYDFSLEVKDAEGNPIKGIAVTSQSFYGDTLRTDDSGKVNSSISTFPNSLQLELKDTDGLENGGQFAADTVKFEEFTWKRTEKASGAWDNGAFKGSAQKVLKRSQK